MVSRIQRQLSRGSEKGKKEKEKGERKAREKEGENSSESVGKGVVNVPESSMLQKNIPKVTVKSKRIYVRLYKEDPSTKWYDLQSK